MIDITTKTKGSANYTIIDLKINMHENKFDDITIIFYK